MHLRRGCSRTANPSPLILLLHSAPPILRSVYSPCTAGEGVARRVACFLTTATSRKTITTPWERIILEYAISSIEIEFSNTRLERGPAPQTLCRVCARAFQTTPSRRVGTATKEPPRHRGCFRIVLLKVWAKVQIQVKLLSSLINQN